MRGRDGDARGGRVRARPVQGPGLRSCTGAASLPLTFSGKVQKLRLAERAVEEHSRTASEVLEALDLPAPVRAELLELTETLSRRDY